MGPCISALMALLRCACCTSWDAYYWVRSELPYKVQSCYVLSEHEVSHCALDVLDGFIEEGIQRRNAAAVARWSTWLTNATRPDRRGSHQLLRLFPLELARQLHWTDAVEPTAPSDCL